MPQKYDPDVNLYRKPARRLADGMMQALGPGGVLRPALQRVLDDDRLRLDIRHNQFNVYYGGGNLMRAAWGNGAWDLSFDPNYLKGASNEAASGAPLVALPRNVQGPQDAQAWADSFDALMATMDAWWKHHPKTERTDCQDIARANHTRTALVRADHIRPSPPTDFVVIDLEYQWAQRRFDLMAARRNPTPDDPVGWVHPSLAFIEVKSEIGACTGKAGLADHARDFADIVTARGGAYLQGIRDEFTTVIRQKQALGLISPDFPFLAFSPAQPELIFVTVDLDLTTPARRGLWDPVHRTARELDLPGFQLIQLQRRDLAMTKTKAKWI